MKLKIAIVFCLSLFFSIINIRAQAISEKQYFVIIGEFSKLDEAIKLTEEANRNSFNAQYATHSGKNEYYVYLLQISDQKKAKSFLKQIRKETNYKKAWLYKGNPMAH